MSAAAAPVPLKRRATPKPRPRVGKTAQRIAAQYAHRETFLKPSRYAGPMNYPASNWFAFPADLLLLLRDKSANKAQDLILIYIATRTWGTKAKKEEDPKNEVHWAVITITDFVRELMLSTRQVEEMLADALKRGLVSVRKAGNQRLYQLAPQNWKEAPDYAAEPDAAEPDAAEPDAAEPVQVESFVLMPGKSSKPMPMHLKCRGIAAPVEVRFEARNEIPDLPLEIRPQAKGGGLFSVTVRLSSSGDKKANEPRTVARGKLPQVVDNTPNDIAVLAAISKRHFDKPIDIDFRSRLLTNLDGAPILPFSLFADEEIYSMRKKRKEISSGILNFLTLSFSRSWAQDAAFRNTWEQRVELERERAAVNARPAVHGSPWEEARLLRETQRAHAEQDPAEYERWIAVRAALGETDWPTLEELGVSRA